MDQLTRPRIFPERPIEAGWLATLTDSEIRRLSPEEQQHILSSWCYWAREDQWPAGDWRIQLLLGGRGSGKTRTGAEWIRLAAQSNQCPYITMVGPSWHATREVMVEGESGLLSVFPKELRPTFQPGLHRITFQNGAVAAVLSADDPERLRRFQHALLWCDEIAYWPYPSEAYDNLMFGLRLGSDPRCIITCTPRPIPLLKELVKRFEDGDPPLR